MGASLEWGSWAAGSLEAEVGVGEDIRFSWIPLPKSPMAPIPNSYVMIPLMKPLPQRPFPLPHLFLAVLISQLH